MSPYIKQEDRKKVDPLVEKIIETISSEPTENQDGMINYLMSKVLLGIYKPKYFNFNRAMGVLNCITQEFYRRFVAPYEDEKIKENGDIK